MADSCTNKGLIIRSRYSEAQLLPCVGFEMRVVLLDAVFISPVPFTLAVTAADNGMCVCGGGCDSWLQSRMYCYARVIQLTCGNTSTADVVNVLQSILLNASLSQLHDQTCSVGQLLPV